MKKHFIPNFFLFIFASLFLSSCSITPNTNNNLSNTNLSNLSNNSTNANEEYNDPDGFHHFAGEPTRQIPNYVILEDICGQFTQQYMENTLGKKIAKIEPSKIDELYNCKYYLADKPNDYVMLILDYLSTENQKKGQEFLGRKVISDSSIPMDNMVAYQENNLINTIHLNLGSDKFIAIERSSAAALTEQENLDLAKKIGEKIKSYK